MGLLWICLAAKVVNDHQKKYYGGSSKTKSNTKSQRSNYHHSDSSYYEPKHNYYDCVMEEIHDKKSDLYNFFSLLLDEYKKDIDRTQKIIEDKRNDLVQKLESATPNLDKFIEVLAKKGINVKHELLHFNQNYNHDKYYSLNYNKHSWPGLVFSSNINSTYLRIDINNIDKNNVNSVFEDEIQKQREYIIEKEQAIEELNSQIAELTLQKEELNSQLEINSKKLKYTIFRRKDRLNKIKECNQNINKCNQTIEELKEKCSLYRKNINTYKNNISMLEKLLNMDDEEKELLINSIDEISTAIDITKEIQAIEKELYDFYDRYIIESYKKYRLDTDYMLVTFERLVREGKISQENLEKIFVLLDGVEIKGRRGEYEFAHAYRIDGLLKEIVVWFIKNVYELDETFVDRNYELPEETENQKIKKL